MLVPICAPVGVLMLNDVHTLCLLHTDTWLRDLENVLSVILKVSMLYSCDCSKYRGTQSVKLNYKHSRTPVGVPGNLNH